MKDHIDVLSPQYFCEPNMVKVGSQFWWLIFAIGAERRGIHSKSPAPNRKERDVRTISSVGGCCRSSPGISDGTGVGILKSRRQTMGHCRSI
jgi:hypothetical protein